MRSIGLLPFLLLAQSPAIKTGPETGTRIPPFQLPDQNGRLQSLESLRGDKGLMLAFVRSADW
jgi:hypothetical protein